MLFHLTPVLRKSLQMNPAQTSQVIALQFNTMIQHPGPCWCWGDAPQNGKLTAEQGTLCFLGRSQLITTLSSSRVPIFNEGRKAFCPLAQISSQPSSGFSVQASLEGALWKAASWSARRLDPVASAWEQECSQGWQDLS